MTSAITSPPTPKAAEARRKIATVRKTGREKEIGSGKGKGIGMKRKDGTITLKSLELMRRSVFIFHQ